MSTRIVFWSLVLACCCLFTASQSLAQTSVIHLVPGAPLIARTGEVEARLRLDLKAGDYFEVIVAHLDKADLKLTLEGPAGEILAERDHLSGPRFDERLDHIADQSGRHILNIERLGDEGGEFEATLTTLRPARAEDHRATKADNIAAAAMRRFPTSRGQQIDTIVSDLRQAGEIWLALERPAPLRLVAATLYGLLEHTTRKETRDEALSASIKLWQSLDSTLGRSPADAKGLGLALNRQGFLEFRRHEDANAATSWHKALAARQRAEDLAGEATTRTNLGGLWSRAGELWRALEEFQTALEIQQQIGTPSSALAATHNNLGFLHRQTGAYERARWHYEHALRIARQHNRDLDELKTLTNLGTCLQMAGDLQGARRIFLEALAREATLRERSSAGPQPTHNASVEAAVSLGLGRLALEAGNFQEARRKLEQAEELRRVQGSPTSLAAVLISLGDLERSVGDLDAARTTLDRGLALARQGKSRYLEAALRIRLARVLAEGRAYEEAREQGRATLRLLEDLRGAVFQPDLRSSFLASRRRYYEIHLGILFDAWRTQPADDLLAEAFEIAERAHARSLLERLNQGRIEPRPGIDDELFEREARLQLQLGGLSRRQRELLRASAVEATAEAVQGIAVKIDRVRADLSHVRGQIFQSRPELAALRRSTSWPLQEFQRDHLRDDELLLLFTLGEKRSFLLAVDRRWIDLFVLPPRAELESLTAEFLDALTVRSRGGSLQVWKKADQRARQLAIEASTALFGPVASRLGRRPLILVPDGALYALPFAALPHPIRKPQQPSQSSWFKNTLVARHPLTLQPSASTIALLRASAPPVSREIPRIAVWADAIFDPQDLRVKPPSVQSRRTGSSPPIPQQVTRRNLHRLYASAQEADAIAKLHPTTDVFSGLAAQRSTLAGARRWSILHFATHGIVDSQRPELSGLMLSTVDGQGRPQDGLLRLQDIYDLELEAELVVLSACETAFGKEMAGEGLVSLLRGFLFAGAQRVIGSQWRVDDHATARLMTSFYSAYLKRGLPPAEALRAAQLDMVQHPRLSHPYYWAGFLLQGEWR